MGRNRERYAEGSLRTVEAGRSPTRTDQGENRPSTTANLPLSSAAILLQCRCNRARFEPSRAVPARRPNREEAVVDGQTRARPCWAGHPKPFVILMVAGKAAEGTITQPGGLSGLHPLSRPIQSGSQTVFRVPRRIVEEESHPRPPRGGRSRTVGPSRTGACPRAPGGPRTAWTRGAPCG